MQQKIDLATGDVASVHQTRPRRRLGVSHLLLILWGIYIASNPIYVFPSGYPQPADVVMAILILILFTGYFARIPLHASFYLIEAAFLTVVAVVNWFWYSQYQDFQFALSSIFYAYDFLVVVAVITMKKEYGHTFLNVTQMSLIIAIIIELCALVFLQEHRGIRAIATFNNPNQVGYWTLLTLACLFVLKDQGTIRYGDLALIVALGYISANSLSKAAMLSVLALMVIGIWCQGMAQRRKIALVLLLAIFAGFMSVQWQRMQGPGDLTYRVVKRLQGLGEQKDDLAEGRGYDRIWRHPEHLILGAGEGAYERFYAGSKEMHSTFGTVVFSYGILGSTFFLAILWQVFRRAPFKHLLYFGPICVYGITHQGLRFSLLWVFLGLVFSSAHYIVQARAAPRGGQISPAVRLVPIGRQRGRRSDT